MTKCLAIKFSALTRVQLNLISVEILANYEQELLRSALEINRKIRNSNYFYDRFTFFLVKSLSTRLLPGIERNYYQE